MLADNWTDRSIKRIASFLCGLLFGIAFAIFGIPRILRPSQNPVTPVFIESDGNQNGIPDFWFEVSRSNDQNLLHAIYEDLDEDGIIDRKTNCLGWVAIANNPVDRNGNRLLANDFSARAKDDIILSECLSN